MERTITVIHIVKTRSDFPSVESTIRSFGGVIRRIQRAEVFIDKDARKKVVILNPYVIAVSN